MSREEEKNKLRGILAEIVSGTGNRINPEENKLPPQSQGLINSDPLAVGSLDIAMGFRQCLRRAIAASGKDLYEIAGEIDRLTKSDFTKNTLDKCISNNFTYGIHAEWLTAFCYVVGTVEPFQYLLEPLGSNVVTKANVRVTN